MRAGIIVEEALEIKEVKGTGAPRVEPTARNSRALGARCVAGFWFFLRRLYPEPKKRLIYALENLNFVVYWF